MLTSDSEIVSRRTFYWCMSLLLIVGLLLRLVGLNKGMWFDEYVSLQIATATHFVSMLKVYDYPPAYFLLLKVWAVFSNAEPFLRLFSVLLGLANLLVFSYWLKFYSTWASLLGVLLLAVSPTLLRYSQELQTYPLLLFTTTLCFWFATRVVNTPKSLFNIVGLAVALSLTVTVHLVGVILLPCVALYAFALVPYNQWRQVYLPLFSALGIAAVFFVILFFLFLGGAAKSSWWMPSPSVELVSSILKSVSGWSALFGLLPFLSQKAGISALLFEMAIKAGVVGSFVALILLGNWQKSFPLLAAALLFWLLLLAYSLLRTPIFWDRTITPGLIPFFAFLAVQITTIRSVSIRRLVYVAIVLLSLVWSSNWLINQAMKPYEEWRPLVKVLQSEWQPDDLVVGFPFHATLPVEFDMHQIPKTLLIGITNAEQLATAEALIRTTNPHVLFLVIRHDFTSINNHLVYEQLDAFLHAVYGTPVSQQDWDVLTLIQYGSSDAAPQDDACPAELCTGKQP